MIVEKCIAGICFTPLLPNEHRIFGFSEFLASLALMILAWTIADVRYRFRILTAPIPLRGLSFAVVTTVGVLTLLTDLWQAQGWLVPVGDLLTPATWQALLAGLFLLTFLTWAWFAFIRPTTFSKWNAKRYAQTVYRFILKGDPVELAVVADELTYSAKALVWYATDRGAHKNYRHDQDKNKEESPPSSAEAYANDLLLLIADKRLCRVIVGSSPVTALVIFQEMKETKKYGISIETFAKNIITEALENKDSFLYHETIGYESGLIGYLRPLSNAIFSDFQMVETIGSLLDPDIMGQSKWHATQWEAYCRVVLMVFSDYVDKDFQNHSFALYRAITYIERAASDLYKLNGVASIAWDCDVLARLRVVIAFIRDAVNILAEKSIPKHLQLRLRKDNSVPGSGTSYDHLSKMIFEIIFAASTVKSPKDQCWSVQYTSVWGQFFNFYAFKDPAGKVVQFKVRRLLYNEVLRMNKLPNFKGANILGFCLNVMGLVTDVTQDDKDSRALHKAILSWTKKHYDWLHQSYPEVAEACLVEGITYDAENHRIVKTYPAGWLQRQTQHVYLSVDIAPPSQCGK